MGVENLGELIPHAGDDDEYLRHIPPSHLKRRPHILYKSIFFELVGKNDHHIYRQLLFETIRHHGIVVSFVLHDDAYCSEFLAIAQLSCVISMVDSLTTFPLEHDSVCA